MPGKTELFTHAPVYKDGYLIPSDRPGWGTEPIEAALAAHPAQNTLGMFKRTEFGKARDLTDVELPALQEPPIAMNEPVDVVIIGAGASGAAFAWSIAETKMRVLCLEQGAWPSQADFPSNGRDWEARQSEDYAISPNRRGLAADYPINEDDSPIKIANFNGVGGGTVLYAGHFPRLHPSDFRVRSLDGVADDWPIEYATLEPFYALNDRMMGIASLAGDPAYPPKDAVMPPIPMGKTGEKIGTAMNSLGWHWWPSDAAIATQDYQGRAPASISTIVAPAARRVPRPALTSPTGRKRSAPASNCAPPAASAGSRRMRMAWRPASLISTPTASEVFQPAEIVVMACNGIGTPRILLNSASSAFPTASPIPAGWSART